MFYYCNNCDTDISVNNNFDPHKNCAPEMKCPKCGKVMDYDYCEFASYDDYEKSMTDYMLKGIMDMITSGAKK